MKMNWDSIIGHEENIAQLQQLLQAERLPHALLFCGPRGIGKFLTARVLAAALLCEKKTAACGSCPSCQAILTNTHPDLYEIEPDGKTVKMIKIEQIRRLQAEISRAPYLADKRVVIINEADSMNETAANSLLKTLEEPTGQVVFILVAARRDGLLDTIVSRSRLMPFQPLPREKLAAALRSRGLPEEIAGSLAGLAEGSFGRALELYENGGLALRDEALEFLARAADFSLEAVWSEGQRLGELKRDKLQEWTVYVNMLLRDFLVLYGAGAGEQLYNSDVLLKLSAQLPAWPLTRIFGALEAVRTVQKRLTSNVNTRLLMEQFLLKIRDLK